jgi:hypothetical protein
MMVKATPIHETAISNGRSGPLRIKNPARENDYRSKVVATIGYAGAGGSRLSKKTIYKERYNKDR